MGRTQPQRLLRSGFQKWRLAALVDLLPAGKMDLTVFAGIAEFERAPRPDGWPRHKKGCVLAACRC